MRRLTPILNVLLGLAMALLLGLAVAPAPRAEARTTVGPMLTFPAPKWETLDVVTAQALPPVSIWMTNATYTGAPVGVKAIIPALNPDTPVFAMAVLVRPEGGGGLWVLRVFTMDGILAQADMRLPYGFQDCFGGAPFVSSFSGKIIVIVNCKPPDAANGNDRMFFPVNTGIDARDFTP